MKRFLLALASCIASLALLTACQEDRKQNLGSTPTNTPAAESVRPVLYGYYGSWDYSVTETQDHATLQWVTQWGSQGDGYIESKRRLLEARAAGTRCVMLDIGMAYSPNPERDLRNYFAQLDRDGLIDSRICALYPMDEPDINVPGGEVMVREGNAMVRRVAAEFPFIPNIPLAAIYTGQNRWTAIDTFDWVGFDDYGAGSGVLRDERWAAMKAKLRPDQRILLVPGAFQCDNPWDFYAKAQEDQQVVAIIGFIWYDSWDREKPDSKGLRSQPCKQDYIAAAMRLKGAQ